MIGAPRAVFMGAAGSSPAAVTLGSVEVGGPFAGGVNWTYSTHDLTADDDLILVFFAARDTAGPPEGVTYGGVAMTAFTTPFYTNGTHAVFAYYLLQAGFPSVGANKTVDVGYTGAERGSVCTIACRGAAQEAPQQNGANTSSAEILGPTSVSVDAGAALFQAMNLDGGNNTVVEGGGETMIAVVQETLNVDEAAFSYKLNAAGPTGSMSFTWTSLENGAHFVVGVNPA